MKTPNTQSCGLCHNPINLSKDNYVRLTDYFQGKFHLEGFYHSKCYHDKLYEHKDIAVYKDKALSLISRASKMLDEAGFKDEKEVYIT